MERGGVGMRRWVKCGLAGCSLVRKKIACWMAAGARGLRARSTLSQTMKLSSLKIIAPRSWKMLSKRIPPFRLNGRIYSALLHCPTSSGLLTAVLNVITFIACYTRASLNSLLFKFLSLCSHRFISYMHPGYTSSHSQRLLLIILSVEII